MLFRREQWNRTILLLDMNQLSAPADLLTITSQSSMLPCWLQCEQELFVPVPLTCFDSCSDYGLRIPPQGCPVHHLYEHDGLQCNSCHHCCQWIRFSLIFMMLDPEHRQSVSWMQLHASGESTGFLSLSTPVRRHACFQLAANQSSLMIACGHVMLMMFPAEFTATHVLPSDYPSWLVSCWFSSLNYQMTLVNLHSCAIMNALCSVVSLSSEWRESNALSLLPERSGFPFFPSFRMALFSIINIKSPGTIFVPLYGSGTCLCWLFLFYQHCILVLMLDASWNQFAGLNCHSLSFIQ